MQSSSGTPFLHELIRREARSLMQYLGDAVPWVPARDHARLDRLLAISRRERDAIDNVIRASLRSKMGNPVLGPYPEPFMDLNFVALDMLVPRLTAEQQKRVSELEWAVLTAPEFARAPLRELIRIKREHLAELQQLAAPQPAAAG